ncbi:hypothetical protein KRP22_005163 [Phytophthora ramorum]|nr:DNA repair protein RAD50 [Phytophthora ramorum]
MLGVSKAILESVIFCHQEDSNWPLREGAELKKRFDNIFESARYTKALEAIRKLKKARMDNAKDYKRDLDVLTVNMKTAEKIREKIEIAQERLREATEEGEEVMEKIAKAEETLDELQQLQQEVKKLHDQLGRRQEDVEQKEASVRHAYGKIENIMSDTDQELQGFLNDYDTIIEEHRRAFSRLQEQEARLQAEQHKVKEEYATLRASKGRAEANIDTYQKMVAELIDSASKLSTKTKQEEVNNMEVKHRQEADTMTTELSELTSQVKRLRSDLSEKNQSLEALNQEKRVIANRLRELGGAGQHSQRDAEEMSTQVAEAEKTLEEYKTQHDTMALKDEIQGFNRQINTINDVIDRLGLQVSQLRIHAQKNAEIEFKRSDYLKKQETFHASLSEKVADFDEIFEGGEKPTDRASLLSAIRHIDSRIVEQRDNCGLKKKELASAEQRLVENATSSRLAEKESNLFATTEERA